MLYIHGKRELTIQLVPDFWFHEISSAANLQLFSEFRPPFQPDKWTDDRTGREGRRDDSDNKGGGQNYPSDRKWNASQIKLGITGARALLLSFLTASFIGRVLWKFPWKSLTLEARVKERVEKSLPFYCQCFDGVFLLLNEKEEMEQKIRKATTEI